MTTQLLSLEGKTAVVTGGTSGIGRALSLGLADAGADVVGANCEITAEEMLGLVAELRAATTAPLVIQPNAGQPRLADGHTVYGETPERFASFMPAIVAAGANIVGGCCGTTPAHIAALAAALGR